MTRDNSGWLWILLSPFSPFAPVKHSCPADFGLCTDPVGRYLVLFCFWTVNCRYIWRDKGRRLPDKVSVFFRKPTLAFSLQPLAFEAVAKARRSWNMSRIRGKHTTPEKAVRSLPSSLLFALARGSREQ